MSKHEIEVEGLPEGWEPVAIRKQKLGEHVFCLDTGCVVPADHRTPKAHLIVKKKQRRRIRVTFEETDHTEISGIDLADDVKWRFCDGKYWREVKETEEPKLCFSFGECEHILRIAVLPKSVEEKIKLFLRNNNKMS